MDTDRLLKVARVPLGKRAFRSCASCCFGVAPLVLCMAFWPFGSSGKKIQMLAGTRTPAAHGQVVVKHGPNGNLQLDVKTEHLAEPGALTPAENVYVVWLQQPNQKPQNLGELQVDKNLNGELHTDTPYKRFKLFITAEQRAQAEKPQDQKVLSANVVGG